MHDDNMGAVKYQTLMSQRNNSGGGAALYLPHLKPKGESTTRNLPGIKGKSSLLSPRNIGTSDGGSPRVHKSIFSPVLQSRNSTADNSGIVYKVSI